MGSMANTNWPPYNGYRDCSQGICSMYCPQWCYIIFPPPPPFESQDDDGSGMNFSPLIIVVIGILASAFLLISYYTIISKYCKRGSRNQLNHPSQDSDYRNQSSATHDQLQQHAPATGLDESLIKSIAVCRYRKGDGVVEGSADCAVCLCEFQEGESLRLLPKCNHAFHLPCIDAWLRSHSNCPLCRSHVMPGIPVPFRRPLESEIPSSNLHVSSLVFQRRNDLVLVVEETPRGEHRDEAVVVNFVRNENLPKYPSHDRMEVDGMGIPVNMGIGDDQELIRNRRSSSLGSMSCQNPNLLIADILQINEEDYENHDQEQEGENSKSTMSSRRRMKRSVSTGRFMFTKGKDSILPN